RRLRVLHRCKHDRTEKPSSRRHKNGPTTSYGWHIVMKTMDGMYRPLPSAIEGNKIRRIVPLPVALAVGTGSAVKAPTTTGATVPMIISRDGPTRREALPHEKGWSGHFWGCF